jgi:hypothetical protein
LVIYAHFYLEKRRTVFCCFLQSTSRHYLFSNLSTSCLLPFPPTFPAPLNLPFLPLFQLELARKLEKIAAEKGVQLFLASDVIVADKFAPDANNKVTYAPKRTHLFVLYCAINRLPSSSFLPVFFSPIIFPLLHSFSLSLLSPSCVSHPQLHSSPLLYYRMFELCSHSVFMIAWVSCIRMLLPLSYPSYVSFHHNTLFQNTL